eukprot:TRINITY_DN2148_c0_g1_i1.p1 TRINITY_DN2148_c0_g1~~TRINITY_DN2148_c0_g1_i1.p1  ORF type:complete len:299 (+),score=72.05 TRINITY_DN2148_c0_g1_i1:64-960(+)
MLQALRLASTIARSVKISSSSASFGLQRPQREVQNGSLSAEILPNWYRTFTTSNEALAKTISLGNLQDNPGARKKKIRLGRGTGGGRGKTSGKGNKGQKARSGGGNQSIGFEGGQTPLYKRMRKFGFTNNRTKIQYEKLNLDRLPYYINKGKLDISKKLTMKDLLDAGCVSRIRDGVKLLGRGAETFNFPINIEVSSVSKSAEDAIKKAGGSVTTAYYSRLSLRHLIKPEKFERAPKRPTGLWSKSKLKDGRFSEWAHLTLKNKSSTNSANATSKDSASQMSKSSSGSSSSSNSSPSS